MKQKLIPILDNGHGFNTAGKRSPIWSDGSQLFEYEFNRDIVRRLGALLERDNIQYEVLVKEQKDIPLSVRCAREHILYRKYQGKTMLLSIHANAGGGTGWECYTSKGRTKADKFADELCRKAKELLPKYAFPMRFDLSDGDMDKEANFYILKYSKSPAVLSENLFMDREKDCRFIMSEEGRDLIAKIHYETIKEIIYL